MPLITVRTLEGLLTDAQKKLMVERVTDAALSVEGEAFRPVTWVIVEEVPSGAWGIAGATLTTRDARAMRDGKSA
ncbi:MAG TPA: tautomerase family protein [Steroidobacteraceae bacterium]|jgi:4-oxalocrotonate tautomerase|nr:tautomerase family protein [Steroidobacteraceae bacterium]